MRPGCRIAAAAAPLAAGLLAAAIAAAPAPAPTPAAAPVPAAAAAPTDVVASATGHPPIAHVFIILLENRSYEQSFGPDSPARYLKSLRLQGASVPNYYATSHLSLGNYVTLISGQAPNPATNDDCPVFREFAGAGTTADGQAIGRGCVYPADVRTIAQQLEQAGLGWKAYMEDMGNIPSREAAACAHPALGAVDNTQQAVVGDQYATRHNPFVYFHAIIDRPDCARHVVNLRELTQDLKSIATTPNYAFITPNLCHDGHDGGGSSRCVDGEPGGLVSVDEFLSRLVPQILSSAAYRRDGLLIISFDEADIVDDPASLPDRSSLARTVAAACCDEPPGPNLPAYRDDAVGWSRGMNGPGLVGPGGGRVGAVMLSPCIRPGTVTTRAYNHYALLRSVEDLFGLAHLGYAAQRGLSAFGADIYSAAADCARRRAGGPPPR